MVFLHGTARDQRVGWWIESWGQCNIAEFPDAIARAGGEQVWSDRSGHRLPTTVIVSTAGPTHCSWESMTFLHLGGDDSIFLRKPLPELEEYTSEPFVAAMPLPSDAVDTGWSYQGRHLWTAPGRERVYVGSADNVESWPRQTKPLGCA